MGTLHLFHRQTYLPSQAYKIVRTQQLKGYKEGKDWKIPKTSLIEYVQQKVHSSILEKNKRGR